MLLSLRFFLLHDYRSLVILLRLEGFKIGEIGRSLGWFSGGSGRREREERGDLFRQAVGGLAVREGSSSLSLLPLAFPRPDTDPSLRATKTDAPPYPQPPTSTIEAPTYLPPPTHLEASSIDGFIKHLPKVWRSTTPHHCTHPRPVSINKV